MQIDNLYIPIHFKEYLKYLRDIKGLSINTIKTYYGQLSIFFRWVLWQKDEIYDDPDDPDINDITIEIIKSLSCEDVYEYLSYLAKDRKNSASSRCLKLTVLNSYFGWLTKVKKEMVENIVEEIESPKKRKRQPKYLDREECQKMLTSSMSSATPLRDKCIITMFINCGLRLSELVSIEIDDIRGNKITVIGKGDKERTIYLNDSTIESINLYVKERRDYSRKYDRNLFISPRTGKKLTNRGVQKIVEKILIKAGLQHRGYSTHKLRHTAATHLYKNGVPLLSIKELLGHSNISTTDIYTHIDQEDIRDSIIKVDMFKEAL